MPHTDTNISRDALHSYGMQPARKLNGERDSTEKRDPEGGGAIRIYSDGEDGRKYMIDRVKRCERRASRKAGGMGLMYTCMVEGQEVNLFYEENQRWFVTRK